MFFTVYILTEFIFEVFTENVTVIMRLKFGRVINVMNSFTSSDDMYFLKPSAMFRWISLIKKG